MTLPKKPPATPLDIHEQRKAQRTELQNEILGILALIERDDPERHEAICEALVADIVHPTKRAH